MNPEELRLHYEARAQILKEKAQSWLEIQRLLNHITRISFYDEQIKKIQDNLMIRQDNCRSRFLEDEKQAFDCRLELSKRMLYKRASDRFIAGMDKAEKLYQKECQEMLNILK